MTRLNMTTLGLLALSLGCGQQGNLGGNIEMLGSSSDDDGGCDPVLNDCTPTTDDGATGNGETSEPATGTEGPCNPMVDPACDPSGGTSGSDDGPCNAFLDPACDPTGSTSGAGTDDGECNPMLDPTCDPTGGSTGCAFGDENCDPSGTTGACDPMIDPTCDPSGTSGSDGAECDPLLEDCNVGTSTGCSPMDPLC